MAISLGLLAHLLERKPWPGVQMWEYRCFKIMKSKHCWFVVPYFNPIPRH